MRKTFSFKHYRKFFKKNKKYDDVLKKEKTGACKKFKHAKRDKSKLKNYNCGNKGHLLGSALSRNRYGLVQITNMLMFLTM